MCGILGYFGQSLDTFNKYVSLNSISHRGPDSSDSIQDKNYYLGHTRLSILDLSSNGSQPMHSYDKKNIIIFNGEIYNHLDLREKYLSDIEFRSTSDTETLLYGLIKYGESFINHLNGIFSFAFLNIESNDFIIARDHFGIKPLYYHISKNELLFSSELKAIIPYVENSTINEDALKNYINYLWSPGEVTPINEVKKLLQGNFIKGNIEFLDEIKIIQYYSVPYDPNLISKCNEEELISQLEEKLIKAVERQMLSDVPIGFFLSGGLDSSLIVAIARRINPTAKIKCFTIKTKGIEVEGFKNDYFYAKKVAKYLDVELIDVESNVDIIKDFDKIIYHLDEPQADPAPFLVNNICIEARKRGIKVLLGGVAGDDLFSGYRRHKAIVFEKNIRLLPLFIRTFIKKSVILLNSKNPLVRRFQKLFKNINLSIEESLFGYFDWIDKNRLNALFLKEKDYDVHHFFRNIIKEIPSETSNLNKMLFLEINSFLTSHNLNYTDKLSMANGIEVRVPFLDTELVEFSTIIPPNLKLKNHETKYILKKVAERFLPNDIIYRPKTGFGLPVRNMIINDMDVLIDDYLSKESIEKRGIFNYDQISELIKINKKGQEDLSYPIWSLLSIESWMRQFIDKK